MCKVTNITLIGNATNNYFATIANIAIQVAKLPSTITVPSSFTTVYGNTDPFNLNATTNNSETPIIYSSSNPIVANVVNGIVTIGNVGTSTITMIQGNTANYLYTSATSIIYVNKKQPTITVDPVYNKLLRDVSFQLMSTTNNNETPIQYTSLNPTIVTAVSDKVIIGNVGNTIMTLYQPETTNYLSVSANTLIYITNNAYQKVGNLIQLQELVNSGGKTFYVKKSQDNYINIVVSIINK